MGTYRTLLISVFLYFSCVQASSLANGGTCIVSNYDDVAAAAATCNNLIIKDLIIPKKTTLNIPLKDGAKLVFDGTLTHIPTEWVGILVKITGTNVEIVGTNNHLLDGMGPQHWKGASEPVIVRPNFFRIEVENATVRDLYLKNCPNHCIILAGCSNVIVSNITIDNYEGYPGVAGTNFAKNTDGFDIRNSTNLRVANSVIVNQDDCVAVNSGSNLVFDNLHCNGSHGLSISVMNGDILDLQFLNSRVEYAGNAIHVKTHSDGGPGTIKNVLYKNIEFVGIDNYAVSIQQNYPNGTILGNVPITNLTLENVKGSMRGTKGKAFQIICAKDACSDWHFKDVEVTGAAKENECVDVPDGITC